MRRFFKVGLGRRVIVLAALGLVLIAGFYVHQNRTGKRAWEKYKERLQAQGENLDWNACVPPPVPDDQNIFAAPKMQQWFVKGEPSDLNIPSFPASDSIEIARVEFARSGGLPESYDLSLRYDGPVLSLLSEPAVAPGSEALVYPLIRMEDVPIRNAVGKLAELAALPQPIDISVLQAPTGTLSRSSVSIHWTNVTAEQALKGLLANYNLQLAPGKEPGLLRVIAIEPGKPQVYCDSAAREQIARVIEKAAAPLSVGKGRSLKSCLDSTFAAEALDSVRPARILVRSELIPAKAETERFFSPEAIAAAFPGAKRVEVEALNSNLFAVYVPSVVSARDYLDWSDRLEPKFSLIRSGLDRPFARMRGDYDTPTRVPIPNFIAVRQISQILAQRAQCHLLVNEPDKALEDLTLLHKVSRLLEARPEGKPMTLVAAMINVAITGLYATTVGDGLRLHAWGEPQLIELQRQLGEINLPPFLVQSLREERAAVCHTLENIPPTKLNSIFSGKATASLWQKMSDPRFWLLSQMPRGWVYENMMTVASLDQRLLAGFDGSSVVRPKVVDEAMSSIEKSLSHFSPANFLAAQMIPNYLRATRTTASNQTLVNQALIACALERYHSMHNAYPARLEALEPDLIAKVPRDLISGIPLHYSLRENGSYLLYSVGWNETDEHGLAVQIKAGTLQAMDLGDWVWNTELARN